MKYEHHPPRSLEWIVRHMVGADWAGSERRYLAKWGHKRCRTCRRVLPISCFGRRRKGLDGLQISCKDCRRRRAERKRLRLPEKVRIENEKRRTKAWLRFSRSLLETRGRRCEACGKAIGDGVAWGCHSLIDDHDSRDPGDYVILCAPCHGKRHDWTVRP